MIQVQALPLKCIFHDDRTSFRCNTTDMHRIKSVLRQYYCSYDCGEYLGWIYESGEIDKEVICGYGRCDSQHILDTIAQYDKYTVEINHRDKIFGVSMLFSMIVFFVSAFVSAFVYANYMIDNVEFEIIRIIFVIISVSISTLLSFGLSYGLLYKFWKLKYYTTLDEN